MWCILIAQLTLQLIIFSEVVLAKNEKTSAKCDNCVGCEIVRLATPSTKEERSEFIENMKFPSLVSNATNELTETAFKKFAKLLLNTAKLEFNEKIFTKRGVGIFTNAIALVNEAAEASLWSRVEGIFDDHFVGSETKTYFSVMEPFWLELHSIMRKCPENLKFKHLADLLSQKFRFFPQNHPTIEFTKNWVFALNGWLTNLVALYMELMRTNVISNKCGLAKELAGLKEEVEEALKALHYKRYQIIRGVDIFGAITNGTAALQFEDMLTGEKFPPEFSKDNWGISIKWKIDQTFTGLFNDVRQKTAKYTEPLLLRFNEILDVLSGKFVADGCQEISPISSEKNLIDYPKNCLGRVIQKNESPCLLPCDTYGKNDFFCPNGDIFKPDGVQIYENVNNADCIPNWHKCVAHKKTQLPVTMTAQWLKNQKEGKEETFYSSKKK